MAASISHASGFQVDLTDSAAGIKYRVRTIRQRYRRRLPCWSSYLYAVTFPCMPWRQLFGAESTLAMAETPQTVGVAHVSFAANMIFATVTRANFALQEWHYNGIFQGPGNLAAVAEFFIALKMSSG